jgi:pilus assembly protein CpaF
MTPAATSGSPSAVLRLGGPPADPRRKAHARLADRIDLARNRFKPLSLLRAEAKRVLEQFFDQEATTLTRPDRDRLIEDILAESVGFGPLEEVFRDEAVKEVLVLNSATVLGRKNDGWLPMSCRFRDEPQWLAVLTRWAESGEAYVPGPPAFGGFDVRLANGYRAVGILPPPILELPPQAWLTRAAPPTTPSPAAPASSAAGTLPVGNSAVIRTSLTIRGSGVAGLPPARPVNPDAGDSGVISLGSLPAGPVSSASLSSASLSSASMAGRASMTATSHADPLARLRQRVTAKIIAKFAAAGMYDLNALPAADLSRIILAQVTEMIAAERLGYDDGVAGLLADEILASINP